MLLHSNQIRAARALLGWSQQELAAISGVGVATIRRIEILEGPVTGNVSTQVRLRKSFEKAGIHFIDNDDVAGIGVRLEHLHNKRRAKAKS